MQTDDDQVIILSDSEAEISVCHPSNQPSTLPLPLAFLDPLAQHSLEAYSEPPPPLSTQQQQPQNQPTAAAKRAATKAGQQQRERKRAEKATVLEEHRRQRVRDKIAKHVSTGACRRSEVQLIVSRQLLQPPCRRKGDVLRDAFALFPQQIVASDERFENLISWRRCARAVSSDRITSERAADTNLTLIVFSGVQFLDKFHEVQRIVEDVIGEKGGHKVVVVVWGVVRECQLRASRQLRSGIGGDIIGQQALQDLYTLLYVEYGVGTHVCTSLAEAAAYVVHMTDAVANVPYHRATSFLDASLAYRDARRTVGRRTTVLAMQPTPESQAEESGEDDDEEGEEEEVEGAVLGGGENQQSLAVPFMRSEGSGDLGHMYLALLCMIPGVSVTKAQAIRIKYVTLWHLLRAYDDCPSDEHRKTLLRDVRYGHNGRRIGPALSSLIANVLTSTDQFIAIQT